MKWVHPVFKKKVHPLFGYAFLLSAGTIALSSTTALIGSEPIPQTLPAPAPIETRATPTVPEREPWTQDLGSLKNAAAEMNPFLTLIKTNIATLEKQGRVPPAKLVDALGKADQLISIITRANALSDIGPFDAGERLMDIAAEIAANSKF